MIRSSSYVIGEELRFSLAPYLSELFNRSLQEGYLPSSQKAAVVTPLIKKRELDTADRKNYRPISNLTFVSKLLERVVSLKLTAFLYLSNKSFACNVHIKQQRYTE